MTSTAAQTDPMMRTVARRLVLDVFEESALVLCGVIAVRSVDDDVVWWFVKGLDAVCTKALRQIDTIARPSDGRLATQTSAMRANAVDHAGFGGVSRYHCNQSLTANPTNAATTATGNAASRAPPSNSD